MRTMFECGLLGRLIQLRLRLRLRLQVNRKGGEVRVSLLHAYVRDDVQDGHR